MVDGYQAAMRHRAELLMALDEMEEGITANAERHTLMRERISLLRAAILDGRALSKEPNPGGLSLPQLISENLGVLSTIGRRVRRTEVRVLVDEGMAPAAVARALGVSRQRVSMLLKVDNDD